jgi:hypothetical protein
MNPFSVVTPASAEEREKQLEQWWATLRTGPLQGQAHELEAVLNLGLASKPHRYDEIVGGLALRYSGNQKAIVENALKMRYPKAGNMPVDPVNWAAFFARSDAGVYVVDALRFLQAKTSRGVGKAVRGPKAETFNRIVDDAGLLELMPEFERRALVGAKALVAYLGFRRLGDDDVGRPVATMFWPSNVHVVCHPSAPSDERAIVALAARVTPHASAPETQRWWVWTRPWEDNENGTVKAFGGWRACHMRTDGKAGPILEWGDMRLPWVFFRVEQADGGFWPTPESDTIAQIDELNISRSNEQHTVDMQGHGQGVYSGTGDDGEMVIGPDRYVQIGPNEQLYSVDHNPKLREMRESREQKLREIAVARSNNPDTYATTKSSAVSGISRAVANLPHDQRIRELRPRFRKFEEEQLLPTLIAIVDKYAPEEYGEKIGDAVVARVQYGAPPDYEELDQKQRRLELDLKLGVISKATYATLMGHYDNEQQAADDGLSADLVPMATPTASTAGNPLAPTSTAPVTPPPAPIADGEA